MKVYCPHFPINFASLVRANYACLEDVVRSCLANRFWQIYTTIKVFDCNPPIPTHPRNRHDLDVHGLEVRNNRFGHLFAGSLHCIRLVKDLKTRLPILPAS